MGSILLEMNDLLTNVALLSCTLEKNFGQAHQDNTYEEQAEETSQVSIAIEFK